MINSSLPRRRSYGKQKRLDWAMQPRVRSAQQFTARYFFFRSSPPPRFFLPLCSYTYEFFFHSLLYSFHFGGTSEREWERQSRLTVTLQLGKMDMLRCASSVRSTNKTKRAARVVEFIRRQKRETSAVRARARLYIFPYDWLFRHPAVVVERYESFRHVSNLGGI